MRKELTDKELDKIKHFFPDKNGQKGRPPKDYRMMVNAILWIIRIGVPWRDLAQEYGSWKSVYTRFRIWSRSGLWYEIFEHISKNRNNGINMINSTIVRVHQQASGAKGAHFFSSSG